MRSFNSRCAGTFGPLALALGRLASATVARRGAPVVDDDDGCRGTDVGGVVVIEMSLLPDMW